MRITMWFIVINSIAIVAIGLFTATNVQRKYELWNELEAVTSSNETLKQEWNKLRLEESMLVTGALLDQETRDRLGMVVPDSHAVVYVVESASDNREYAKYDKKSSKVVLSN